MVTEGAAITFDAKYYAGKWLVFAAACLTHTFGYLALNRYYHPLVNYDVSIYLDYLIPLVPWWSWFYEALFVMPVCMAPIRELPWMRRAAMAVVTCCVVSWVFFVVMPVSTVGFRPESVPITDASTMFLNFIYFTDANGTCFPSLHVAIAMVFGLIGMHQWKGWGHALFVLSILISLSTIFTKQHYIMDVVAGAALAYASYRLVYLGGFLNRWSLFKVQEGRETEYRDEGAKNICLT
ncbi:MAG: phosphatase PAP2 family protein [Myxococcota bacterium]